MVCGDRLAECGDGGSGAPPTAGHVHLLPAPAEQAGHSVVISLAATRLHIEPVQQIYGWRQLARIDECLRVLCPYGDPVAAGLDQYIGDALHDLELTLGS